MKGRSIIPPFEKGGRRGDFKIGTQIYVLLK
jgi:hypothetical protein